MGSGKSDASLSGFPASRRNALVVSPLLAAGIGRSGRRLGSVLTRGV